MNTKELIELAEMIIAGNTPDKGIFKNLADMPEEDAFSLMAGADLIRRHFFGREVHLCTIINGKSGRCSENCSFCAQSISAATDAPVYPLLSSEEIHRTGSRAARTPVNRYSVVTSGRGLSLREVGIVAEALSGLDKEGIGTCASLGILDQDSLHVLKSAGVGRYHHNLEAAESHFDRLCTSHTYAQRVQTLKRAKRAGLSICAGGVFGTGENDRQVLELATALKEVDVDSVPLNFLVPIPGTRLEKSQRLTPLRCLKIIALFRFVLPEKEILICGGREFNLQELHPFIFYAGASGIMTSNYLTTAGRSLADDLSMLDRLGLKVRGT
ncbi:MAG: biotin synthase BioB [Syntrophales bacterium]|nr:biotin synthase BioB [Syntrophales bacterium]